MTRQRDHSVLTSLAIVTCIVIAAGAPLNCANVQGAPVRRVQEVPARRIGPDGSVMHLVRGGISRVGSVEVVIEDLWVDAQEVSVEKFLSFIEESRMLDAVLCNDGDPYSVPALVHFNGAESYAAFYKKRLPTKEEMWWVLSERGSRGPFPWGEDDRPPCQYGNYSGEERDGERSQVAGIPLVVGYRDLHLGLAPVCSYQANALGLFDVSGNAWEWTRGEGRGVISRDALSKPGSSATRIRRISGGSFNSSIEELRCDASALAPEHAAIVGFRCVMAYRD